MPAAIDVDREQVRMLVLSVGCREAARQLGLNEKTVLHWSHTGNWLADCRPTPAKLPLPASILPSVSSVKSPVQALQDTISSLSSSTKLNLLRAADKATSALAERAGEALLGMGAEAKAWADTGARAGNWADSSAGSVKIAIFGASESQVIDV